MPRRPILGNDTFGKSMFWWKVWGGACFMVSVGVLALGTWTVVSLANGVTSR